MTGRGWGPGAGLLLAVLLSRDLCSRWPGPGGAEAAKGLAFKGADINLVHCLSGLNAFGHPSDTNIIWATGARTEREQRWNNLRLQESSIQSERVQEVIP